MQFIRRATTVHRAQPQLAKWRKMSTAADGDELRETLSADPPSIPFKYMYDLFGSKLFDLICYTPEYYLTRTERAIFDRHVEDIAAAVGVGVTILIEPGAGNCAKAARLIPFLKPRQYVPIDISAEFLEDAVSGLRSTFPALDVRPLAMDFSSASLLPRSIGQDGRLFFYPGSTIGGLEPAAAVEFLRTLRNSLQGVGGGLLMGVDLVKDKAVLDEAYNDALGIVAAFNRNVLLNVNRLIGADFNVSDWRHRGDFEPASGRVNVRLEAERDTVVTWRGRPDGSRQFRAGDSIHTAYSYKYTPDGVSEMLHRAGFAAVDTWFDPHKWYMVFYAKPI